MAVLIQKLHPALRVGQQPVLAASGLRLFSRQGHWDRGSTLHCVAMALALLGRLSDPVDVRLDGQDAWFWDRAWPHYLHGLTLSELVSFIRELNAGVRPVAAHGNSTTVLRFCTQELAKGSPVIVCWHAPDRTCHTGLVTGTEGRQDRRTYVPHTLLLLDPAETEPQLAAYNARLEAGKRRRALQVTTRITQEVVLADAVSIRLLKDRP